MYQNLHGRFTAVDPLLASGKSANPQTFNRYVYCLNNPIMLTDPDGLQAGRWVQTLNEKGESIGEYRSKDKPINPRYESEITARNRAGDIIAGLPNSLTGSLGDDYVIRFNPDGPRKPQTLINVNNGQMSQEVLSDYQRKGWEIIKSDNYYFNHPATGAVYKAIEPYDVALTLTPFKFSAVGRGTMTNVLVDSNVIGRLSKDATLGGLIRSGETPVVSYVSRPELRNVALQGRFNVPKIIDKLNVFNFKPSLSLRSEILGLIRPGELTRKTERGLFGDGIIGA